MRVTRDHHRHVERIALVTDSAIARVVEILAKPFATAQIRHFAFDHSDEAVSWLRGGAKSAAKMRVVLTSHDRLGNTGFKTGFWLEVSFVTQFRPMAAPW